MSLGLWVLVLPRLSAPFPTASGTPRTCFVAMVRRYELGERSYLREKVVTTYEALWRGEEGAPRAVGLVELRAGPSTP